MLCFHLTLVLKDERRRQILYDIAVFVLAPNWRFFVSSENQLYITRKLYITCKDFYCCQLRSCFRKGYIYQCVRPRSNWRTLLVQHDVTVDHTMLSGVAKLSNLRCLTMCDNVCWTMLKGYVKLTHICWTTNQIHIVIIFSQFFIGKDSSVGSTLAS